MTDDIAFGPGGEFDLVRSLIVRFGSAARGIGDDAGAFEAPAGETLLVSTDVAVENVHFRRHWFTPDEIGYRAVTAAVSDMAAMAATPRAIVVALTLPAGWRRDAESLADGLARAAVACDAVIVGGDVSDGPSLSLAITVIGSARVPLSRAGAKTGDAVWVTGRLGAPAVALRAFEAGTSPESGARDRFAAPVARVREAQWLAACGATAAIDISDGLASDLGHVAAASAARLVLDLDLIPVFAGATSGDAAAGGEEYEIAVTGPASLDGAAFAREFGIELTRVGSVEAGPAGVVAMQAGVAVPLPRGFDHFSP
ncbi:MAG: thiamine-phosphate kinase [Gemmatimonadetes bacterium]|nr:thiamine-phosphate kinase [Gemmatimonadota bacterium]